MVIESLLGSTSISFWHGTTIGGIIATLQQLLAVCSTNISDIHSIVIVEDGLAYLKVDKVKLDPAAIQAVIS